MTLDDLKRIATSRTLFRLDTIVAPKLVPVLYALGLAAILLWVVGHLFLSFGSSFGNGLWGLLEIVVLAPLAIALLRIVCDALLVYFKAHEEASASVARTRVSSSLLDEVRDAIQDLAQQDESEDFDPIDDDEFAVRETGSTFAPATEAGKSSSGPTIRRTAKRMPKANL
jgi:hypothetical protein